MYLQKLGSQCKQPILTNADVKIYFACSQCDDEYIYYDCRVDTTSLLITSAPLVVFHKPTFIKCGIFSRTDRRRSR